MVTSGQIAYLNDYNQLVRDRVGPALQAQGKTAALQWMRDRTEPYTRGGTISGASSPHVISGLLCGLAGLLVTVILL